MAILQEKRKGAALALRNVPPGILFSSRPTILVTIDGPPAYEPSGDLTRARPEHEAASRQGILGACYLHLFDGWMTAPSIDGPWVAVQDPPAELGKVLQVLLESGQPVDLLKGEIPQPSSGPARGVGANAPAKPSLAGGPVPSVFVATSPTELIVTDGEPDWVPVDGTRLLYIRTQPATFSSPCRISRRTS